MNHKGNGGKKIDKKDSIKKRRVILGMAVLVLVNIGLMWNNQKKKDDTRDYTVAKQASNGDVVIKKEEVTNNATFLTVDVDGTKVGLFAVLAGDGTIRTALDTCQVCNGSPQAYFTQNGDKFQCQNCNNLFKLNQIEMESGGCNPIPIHTGIKSETETEIYIPYGYLEEMAPYFSNWNKY